MIVLFLADIFLLCFFDILESLDRLLETGLFFFLFLIIFATFFILFLGTNILNNPGKSKITNFNLNSCSIDQHIGGFEVSVHYIGGMKILESEYIDVYPQRIW